MPYLLGMLAQIAFVVIPGTAIIADVKGWRALQPETADGLLLGATPFGELKSIRVAATYLKISLRPLLGKDTQGRSIELNWP